VTTQNNNPKKPLNIAIISDVFPPKCGGSGWSSFYLARALAEKGHNVKVIIPKEGKKQAITSRDYEGLPVTEYVYPTVPIPFVRNYTRNERLYPRFGAWLKDFFSLNRIEVAHAQHYLTIPATVMAAQGTNVVTLATVRDYWANCYWTTMLNGEKICPGCNPINRLKCLYGNQGAIGIPAAPVSLYMGMNLHLKQRWLAQADAVLAVSNYVKAKLAPFVPANRLQVIPNFIQVDDTAMDKPMTPQAQEPYLLYAGKLEENKGARLLLDILRRSRPNLPILIAGEGALEPEFRQASAELNLHLLGWTEHAEVLRLMAHAEALLFPSLWHEPLSRVLLEAGALGTLVCAINTGGTPDIIEDGVNGILANSIAEFASDLTYILQPERADYRSRLRYSIRNTILEKFSQEVVLDRLETLYYALLAEKRGVPI
jgi:glycogen synthase